VIFCFGAASSAGRVLRLAGQGIATPAQLYIASMSAFSSSSQNLVHLIPTQSEFKVMWSKEVFTILRSHH
jgi:hypothetical protein